MSHYKQRHHDEIVNAMRAAADVCASVEGSNVTLTYEMFKRIASLRDAVTKATQAGGALMAARLCISDSASAEGK